MTSAGQQLAMYLLIRFVHLDHPGDNCTNCYIYDTNMANLLETMNLKSSAPVRRISEA
jgi:hypothetical protein